MDYGIKFQWIYESVDDMNLSKIISQNSTEKKIMEQGVKWNKLRYNYFVLMMFENNVPNFKTHIM